MLKKAQIKKDDEVFSRYEFKYIISKNTSKNIKKEISDLMITDKFTNSNNRYLVRSLYFDNDMFSCFNDKIDGIKIRHKFRIRTYSDKKKNITPIFLEIKGRNNLRTYKRRTKIDVNDLDYFLNKQKTFSLKRKYENNKNIKKFIFDIFKKKISPKVLVDYNRSAYFNKSGLYFRLTFDSDIKACVSKHIFNKNENWKNCISGYEILEVKFDFTIPPWFHRIIQSYELKRISVSKFVLGTEYTNLAHDYEGI